MRRRTMIQMTAASAVFAGTGKLLSAFGADEARVGNSLGVQLWSVRDQLQVDVRQTLAEIAAIGYREVELFGLDGGNLSDKPFFGLSAREFAAALEGVGLIAPITHFMGGAMNIGEIAEVAQEVGVRHLVVPIAPEFTEIEDGEFRMRGVKGRDQLDMIAERLSRQGELARASGVGFGYHNHQMEFADLGDENAFDYLFSQADSDLVKIELDIGWALVAGVDPIEILRRYAGRVIAVHLKDYDPSLAEEDDSVPIFAQLVEPGTGPTEFSPILAALDETGVDHRFVEVDFSPDPMGSITRGFGYISRL